MSKNTYWDNNGKHQLLYNKVAALLPDSGAVPNGRTTNKHLEKLRQAANCYYDLFNNGLCNRAAEFRRVFGFGGKWIAEQRYPHYQPLEDKLDEIILAAAEEQGVEVSAYDLALFEIEKYNSIIRNERYKTEYYIKHGIPVKVKKMVEVEVVETLPVAY